MNRPPLGRHWLTAGLLLLFVGCSSAVQRVDPDFQPASSQPPAFLDRSGPVVGFDESHQNGVTTSGRYRPMIEVLEIDGFRPRPVRRLSSDTLQEIDVLVIGNARHPSDPTRSAFTPSEIDAVAEWVERGGSLMLLVDHQPFPAAASDLARRFGFELHNGYAVHPDEWDPTVFRVDEQTLSEHDVTRGRNEAERVRAVATFFGHAFRAEEAEPLMILPTGYVSYTPAVEWDIDAGTPSIPVGGWLQGAVRAFGQGRIAIFGDATMFSAQISPDGARWGMNSPLPQQNLQFLLNVMRWLSRSPRD